MFLSVAVVVLGNSLYIAQMSKGHICYVVTILIIASDISAYRIMADDR